MAEKLERNRKSIESFEAAHDWIVQEKAFSDDAALTTTSQRVTWKTKARKQLEKEVEQLKKQINRKVMGMIDQAEQQFKDKDKKDGILRDRQLIADTIEELDLKKKTMRRRGSA